MVEWDPALWHGTIMPDVRKFACDVRRLIRGRLEDDGMRQRVLSAVEKFALPLAQLPTVMAADLRAAAAAASAATATAAATAAATATVLPPPLPFSHHEPGLCEPPPLSLAPTQAAGKPDPDVLLSALTVCTFHNDAPVVKETQTVVLRASQPSPPQRTSRHGRRYHPDAALLRLPVMNMPVQAVAPQSKRSRKRAAVTALCDVLSLSSRVKTRTAAAYNTRLRSQSR